MPLPNSSAQVVQAESAGGRSILLTGGTWRKRGGEGVTPGCACLGVLCSLSQSQGTCQTHLVEWEKCEQSAEYGGCKDFQGFPGPPWCQSSWQLALVGSRHPAINGSKAEGGGEAWAHLYPGGDPVESCPRYVNFTPVHVRQGVCPVHPCGGVLCTRETEEDKPQQFISRSRWCPGLVSDGGAVFQGRALVSFTSDPHRLMCWRLLKHTLD